MFGDKKARNDITIDRELLELSITSPTAADTAWTHDGCDQCGHSQSTGGASLAQACFRFTLPSGRTLTMCAHHGRQAEPTMISLGARIDDLTMTLVP